MTKDVDEEISNNSKIIKALESGHLKDGNKADQVPRISFLKNANALLKELKSQIECRRPH